MPSDPSDTPDERSPKPGNPGATDAAITSARRQNALNLFQTFVEERVGAGAPPMGLATEFAALLEISPSLWSQIKSKRPIGNKLARQIESKTGKPAGWLDEQREAQGTSQAEQEMLALALRAMRATNAAGRKRLKRILSLVAAGAMPPEMG